MEVRTYRAVCRRVGDWWAIRVPELKGVHSQARRLTQVPVMAREAIALMLDIDAATIHIDVEPELPDAVVDALVARQAARTTSEDAERATASAA